MQVGHGFGLAHDRRVAASSSSSHAYGAVFAPGQYRTIMAYSSRGERRVNYYSGPGVRYHEVGDKGIEYIHIVDTTSPRTRQHTQSLGIAGMTTPGR